MSAGDGWCRRGNGEEDGLKNKRAGDNRKQMNCDMQLTGDCARGRRSQTAATTTVLARGDMSFKFHPACGTCFQPETDEGGDVAPDGTVCKEEKGVNINVTRQKRCSIAESQRGRPSGKGKDQRNVRREGATNPDSGCRGRAPQDSQRWVFQRKWLISRINCRGAGIFGDCKRLIFRRLGRKWRVLRPFPALNHLDFPPVTKILPNFMFSGSEWETNVKQGIQKMQNSVRAHPFRGAGAWPAKFAVWRRITPHNAA